MKKGLRIPEHEDMVKNQSIAEVFLHEIGIGENIKYGGLPIYVNCRLYINDSDKSFFKNKFEIQSLPTVTKDFNSYIWFFPLRPPQKHPDFYSLSDFFEKPKTSLRNIFWYNMEQDRK